jgi:aspartate aminotransferase-like enzyme
VPWGEAANLDQLSAILKDQKIKAVFTQACETSTATVHPIHEMSKVVRRHRPEALFAVDAITAVGCMPLPMDEWQLDVVVAGSQKAFMIPTGLSFIALSGRAWKAQEQASCAKYYFDLALEKKANARKETHFSTPTPLISGLNMVLVRMQEAGLEQVIRRCEILAGVTRTFGEHLGFSTFSQAPSPSVTALTTPEGMDAGQLRDWLERERNITIMGGQDHLKGKILRIGHMGHINDHDMSALFVCLAEKMQKQVDIKDLEARLGEVPMLFP